MNADGKTKASFMLLKPAEKQNNKIMNQTERTISTLEFDKILQMLADCAPTEGAGRLALSLLPSNDEVVVLRRQRRTSDAKKLMGLKGMPSFGHISDINDSLERAEKSAILTNRELLACANVLRTARQLSDYLRGDKTAETSLDEIFERLSGDRRLEEKITRAIISEDMIADEASAELADIRRKMRNANSKIRDLLQKYITGGTYSKFLQENIVTQRGGRFVIPVKAEYKNEVSGLIHDTSASGATVFVEPLAVVDANNELRILEGKEQREMERILAELSASVASAADALRLDYMNITELAFIFACAELSYRMGGVQPKINEGKRRVISLKKARHPLIDKNICVPVTIRLGDGFDTLVVTGSNTGGKTVALKTLGLFALMAQAGLHIPADEESEICVFDDVLADIGDEQSIEMSLSTFSSSMKNIIDILNCVNDRSLVLFDELGAGTDPIEGAALATAIIEEVRSCGALCAATTHYAELKVYALNTEGVSNAACEFDVETLRPTYRLIIGAPGKSNAFAISTRLGLSQRIVDRAGELVSGESRSFEDVIEKLEAERIAMEHEKEEQRRLRIEYERFKVKAEEKLKNQLADVEKERDRAEKRARDIVASAKASSEFIMAQMEKVKKERESENLGRSMQDAKRAIKQHLRDNEDLYYEKMPEPEEYTPPREYRKGDDVIIAGTGVRGIITDGPDRSGNVTIVSNNITTRTKVGKIRFAPQEDTVTAGGKTEQVSTFRVQRASASFKPELDIRGYMADDGWFAVDKYIDEAIMSGVNTIRIIHGKGTGALRNALHNFMRNDKRISSFRLGAYGEGDAGVTVVELK